MKSLYESILGSTKSGAYSLIQKWCDEHLSRKSWDERETGYMITPDMRISNWTNGKSVNQLHVDSSYDERVPDYIKFSKELPGAFFVGQMLNNMKEDQLPKKTTQLYISGKTKNIPSFKMECTHGFSVNDYAQELEHINPIELEMHTVGHHKPIIGLDNTKIEMTDLKNIKVIGDVDRLKIQNTPAANEIIKEIKKLEKKHGKVDKHSGEQPPYAEYLDQIFDNFPSLRYVELAGRTSLEHNPRTMLWYKL